MEESIRGGNVAVGILMATIMICAALMLYKGLGASLGVLRLTIAAPVESGKILGEAALLIVGHLLLSLSIAVITISATLRLFGHLCRKINAKMEMGE